MTKKDFEFQTKKIKGILVTKGFMEKTDLSNPENRRFIEKIVLSPKIIELIGKNEEIVFILTVKTVFKSKSTRKKLKTKVSFPFRLQTDKNFVLGSSVTVTKNEDNSYGLGVYSFYEIEPNQEAKFHEKTFGKFVWSEML